MTALAVLFLVAALLAMLNEWERAMLNEWERA